MDENCSVAINIAAIHDQIFHIDGPATTTTNRDAYKFGSISKHATLGGPKAVATFRY